MTGSDGLGSLSAAARSLWGKSDYGEGECWLPLYVHMADAAGVAGRLWDRWLPKATRGIVARAVGGADDGDDALARTLLVFLAGVHDVGKATPVFQAKGVPFGMGDARGIAWKPERAGFVLNRDLVGKREPTHPIAGELILERYFGRYAAPGCGASARRSLPSIVGAHHGNFPTRSRLHDGGLDLRALGWDGEGHDAWEAAQDELVGYAARLAGIDDERLGTLARLPLDVAVESLLTGMVIVSDWLASDCDLFPLLVGNGREGDAEEFASESAMVSAWMYGRKKGMLSNFVVCTVDQVLMGALHMRHLSLRQLALANKVVVIDECHAYDLYMRQYLDVLLQWLGYWRVPTILLSATLPDGQRASMAESYLSGRRLSGGASAPVAERRHRAKKLPAYHRKKQQGGAPANAAMPTGATAPVVGTQVLEQSLEIDIDLLVTDVAPVDLLLQRLGRTHRHKRGEGECKRRYCRRERRGLSETLQCDE
jgi:CRISPR-associated endonuclease Cas3-HD